MGDFDLEHYLDNSATTKVSETAAKKVYEMMTENYGNPSSLHARGIKAEDELISARSSIAKALGVTSAEIYFTSGGTEANNLAVFGTVNRLKKRGNKIVTTAFEHSSVYESVKHLEEYGFQTVYVKPNENGHFSIEDFENAIDKNTILVSVMAVNNELGTILSAVIRYTPRKAQARFSSGRICISSLCYSAVSRRKSSARERKRFLLSQVFHRLLKNLT